MEGFSLRSLEEGSKDPTREQHFLPFAGSQLYQHHGEAHVPPYLVCLKLHQGCWGGAVWELCSAAFSQAALSHHLTSPSCPGAGTALLELRSALPVAPALVSSWRCRFWRRLLQAVLVWTCVGTLPAGWLLVAHAGRSAASRCRHLRSIAVLLREHTDHWKRDIIFLSTDVIPDSYSLEGEQWYLGNSVTTLMTFIYLEASANPLYPFMKKREWKWQRPCRYVCPRISWQEKCTFAWHQIIDRKTNEDKDVMDVCKPPYRDPFTEKRESMKPLSICHQTKNDFIS